MLVHGAALDSHVGPQRRQRAFSRPGAPSASDQLRRRQSTADEIVEQARARPPLPSPPPMLLIASSIFSTVGAHAGCDQQRDRGRPSVEPDTQRGAVEDQPHDRLFGEQARIPGVPGTSSCARRG